MPSPAPTLALADRVVELARPAARERLRAGVLGRGRLAARAAR